MRALTSPLHWSHTKMSLKWSHRPSYLHAVSIIKSMHLLAIFRHTKMLNLRSLLIEYTHFWTRLAPQRGTPPVHGRSLLGRCFFRIRHRDSGHRRHHHPELAAADVAGSKRAAPVRWPRRTAKSHHGSIGGQFPAACRGILPRGHIRSSPDSWFGRMIWIPAR